MTSTPDIPQQRLVHVGSLSQALPGWAPQTAANAAMTIGVLPGEGVGPEVIDAALRVLDALSAHTSRAVTLHTGGAIGGEAQRRGGQPLTPEVVAFCASVFEAGGAVLCGPGGGRFVYDLRAEFDLYCKLVPLKPCAAVSDVGPLRAERVRDVDVVVVRENTGGLYFGSWGTRDDGDATLAYQHCCYREAEVERILQVGLRLARQRYGRLCVVTKPGGVPAISELWTRKLRELNTATDVATHVLEVDNAVYQLIAEPAAFDVLVCPNLFGDVLGDGGALLLGSRGMSHSANFAPPGRAVYQTGHGAAWDLAGTNRANPIGQIHALAMMLRESFAWPEAAAAIEAAVVATLRRGVRTADIAGPRHEVVTTDEMSRRISEALSEQLSHDDGGGV